MGIKIQQLANDFEDYDNEKINHTELSIENYCVVLGLTNLILKKSTYLLKSCALSICAKKSVDFMFHVIVFSKSSTEQMKIWYVLKAKTKFGSKKIVLYQVLSRCFQCVVVLLCSHQKKNRTILISAYVRQQFLKIKRLKHQLNTL